MSTIVSCKFSRLGQNGAAPENS